MDKNPLKAPITKNGRPSDAIRHKFQTILEESGAYERLKRIMQTTKDDDIFMKALQISLDRAIGRPVQEVKPVDDQGNYAPFQIFMPTQSSGEEGKTE